MNKYCFVQQVRPDRIEAYRASHAAVWPEMLNALQSTGWRNYALFLRADGLLIGYAEAEDLQASLAAMAELPVNDRWQRAMADLFPTSESLPDEGFQFLDQVFDLDDQLDLIAPNTGATEDRSR